MYFQLQHVNIQDHSLLFLPRFHLLPCSAEPNTAWSPPRAGGRETASLQEPCCPLSWLHTTSFYGISSSTLYIWKFWVQERKQGAKGFPHQPWWAKPKHSPARWYLLALRTRPGTGPSLNTTEPSSNTSCTSRSRTIPGVISASVWINKESTRDPKETGISKQKHSYHSFPSEMCYYIERQWSAGTTVKVKSLLVKLSHTHEKSYHKGRHLCLLLILPGHDSWI